MSDSYDLNLLVALDALLSEGSVTGAASRLHLSVPATSRILGRLRKEFNDPIFVKAGRGLVPTERALALRERVRHVIEEARALPLDGGAFDPASLHRDFRIAGGEAVLGFLAGPLLAYFEVRAPHVRCAFLIEGPGLVLRESPVDLAIGTSHNYEAEVRAETIIVDRLIGACRPGHPLLKQEITRDRYLSARHLGISRRRRGSFTGYMDTALGINRHVVASVPPASAASVLLSGNLLGIFYEMLEGPMLRAMGLATFELPYYLEPIAIDQIWHPRRDRDPAHVWLRQAVKAVVRDALAGADEHA